MSSMEVQGSGPGGSMKNRESKTRKKKKNAKSRYLPKLSCLRTEPDGKGNFDMQVQTIGDGNGDGPTPTHLVVMVNGIIGSAQNWSYAAKQFCCKYPEDLIVHCSERNYSTLTFDGVDVMGERLAEEVISVIKRHPGVQKISFIGHSLGGLVARYAIARLYERDVTEEPHHASGGSRVDESEEDSCQKDNLKGKIAGLEPVNFITCATPHLGSRGHEQVPVFCGFYTLEKVAARGSWLLGRTGKHLFLTDRNEGKPPLLLRMVSDCEDLKFLSALQSFRRRVVYANARFDHIVGWSTSSLRHPKELPKRRHLKRVDKYKHIVNVETTKAASSQREVRSENIANKSETADVEEEMLRCLTTLSWERVDVNFSRSRQRFLAHSTIQVKTYCINSDGAEVIQHMIDNFLL
ncbi:DUF676 domain-containing protein [Citrus sinensis]|uniref:DUF676 domain-containing protein n=2 Tax=Citrus sinensis TaxID=2711 RepID=A0ACB8KNF6_CITSI|nr:DUF676 domain-containing protein [Citrus sinensis]